MKHICRIIATWVVLLALVACSANPIGTTGVAVSQSTTDTSSATSSEATTSLSTGSVITSAAATLAENSATHDDAEDYVWDESTVVALSLNGSTITTEGSGVTVDGSTATITAAGAYRLSGTLSDGQIIVNTQDEGVVQLIFNGVDISSTTSAPVYVQDAEEVVVILADNTENTLTDASSYVFASADVEEPNAALYSSADMSIGGNGSLTVNGNYNDGIASQDGLVIASGTIVVNAVDDGIRGKDYLVVKNGTITVTAQGDGLKSDNDEDATKGYISIEQGTLAITATGDAITAETDVAITDGTLTLVSGGGSNSQLSADASAKGIKATVGIAIEGGTIAVDSADDAVHSNGNVSINNGTLVLASADDAVHADAAVEFNGGDTQITQSYEGIEGAVITVNDGTIHLVASDDGVNVAGGNDSASAEAGPAQGGGFGGGAPAGGNGGFGGRMPGGGNGGGFGGMGTASSQDATTYTGENFLYINGGTLVVDAAGDGLDANGAIIMTGGVVLVNGPIERMNGALDYDGGFNITGGLLIAAGSAGMASAPGTASSQRSVLVNYSATQAAGTLAHVADSEGNTILTFAPTKDYQTLVFSSPALAEGATYTISSGGTSTGTASDGLYSDGSYSGGSEYASFTISDVVTMVGNSAMR